MGKKILNAKQDSMLSPVILTALSLVVIAALLSVFAGTQQGYTSLTMTCISCHNDTGYPNDTNGDGRIAPYERPHNDSVMCESCHLTNPHTIVFIQPDGNYRLRSTAASCPECHQAGIPAQNNTNFTSAPRIPNPLRHSGNLSNGSLWGSYWTTPRTACIFCHNNTLHNTTPVGRILGWASDKMNVSCSNCHYKGDANWSAMSNSFTSAGLQIPPEITNDTNWNGIFFKYFNHSLSDYSDETCKHCHGSLLSANATLTEFIHNVAEADMNNCIDCHSRPQGIYPAVDVASFAKHKNVNTTDGANNLTNKDCQTCHYNITDMMLPGYTTATLACTDCHIQGNYSAPIIDNHRPPSLPIVAGGNITTGAYCSTCHNNSVNMFAYSANASVSHYGTNASLIKPTVNQTPMPRFGFMDPQRASAYNKDCNNCHNPSNPNYGNATRITVAHTANGTCNECHVNVSASDLHNDSLGIPQMFGCKDCHTNTTLANKYKAPNIAKTEMANYNTCEGCHGGVVGDNQLNNLTDHNVDRTYSGTPGYTDTVYLNGQTVLSVIKGTAVTVTSRVNDTYFFGSASRVGGAEYYIDTDPGLGMGTPMDPVDGVYDAVNGNWESVTATIDTGALSVGTHTIFVRGMDIGKQWSAVKSATLTVQTLGFINGTVTSGGLPLAGATVSVTGASTSTFTDGNYSLLVLSGTYDVTASKRPEYYDNTSTGIIVTPNNTTIQNFLLILKPTGTISGAVTSI